MAKCDCMVDGNYHGDPDCRDDLDDGEIVIFSNGTRDTAPQSTGITARDARDNPPPLAFESPCTSRTTWNARANRSDPPAPFYKPPRRLPPYIQPISP